MPNNLTVQQVVAKWSANGASSADAVRAGVNGVTESPMDKAAAAKDRWLAGIQKAAQSGKWENRLRAVTLAQWKEAMVQKGIPNMTTAYNSDLVKRKFSTFMTTWLPFARDIGKQARAMPRGTIQQSIARATFVIQKFYDWGQQRAGAGGGQ